jgi:fatty acyl-CoA reductase
MTGAPSWAAEPFAHAFDEIICGQVHLERGSMTGDLTAAPFVGESRANWLRTYAASIGTDLSASYGYGDSYADVAWLELVGTAHAINPDARLYRHAQQATWIVEDWK